jgi:hypothetical protein
VKLVIGLAAAAMVASGIATGSASAKSCPSPAGAAVIASNRQAVIFSHDKSTDARRLVSYWACARSTGRRTEIGVTDDGDGYGPTSSAGGFRLGGRYVILARAHTVDHRDPGVRTVVRWNVLNGRRHLLASTGTATYTEMRVDRYGSAAWLESDFDARAERLYVRDKLGTRLVATGRSDSIEDVSIGAHRLRWRQDMSSRTARLCEATCTPPR